MAYVDFKEIKECVSIEDVAGILKLELRKSGNQLRGGCPACGNHDERILAITPARNLFYCFDAKKGGDQIALVSHITGLDVKDAAEYLVPHSRREPTTPPAPRKEAKKAEQKDFDPVAFRKKLTYTEQVKAIATEHQAAQFAIGEVNGWLCVCIRHESGTIAGWARYKDGEWKWPKTWLPDLPHNVVKLRA